ncbi:MAG: shikimate kinase [bacterium]
MNIILIGFMGAGKTAVGQKLAAELAMDYLDTDELIEKTEQKTISEIFANDGEERFRELETRVVKTLGEYDNFIISTGGGIVLRPENVAGLKKAGPLVLLWAEPEVIYERVRAEYHRPLLKVSEPLAEIKKILNDRAKTYHQVADLKIDTSELNVSQVTEEIKQWLKSR